jgi:hypothetical protein
VVAHGGVRTEGWLESISLVVYEFDDDELLERIDFFSDDDLAGALEELDERYIAGEGAAHAYELRCWRNLYRAFNRRDWSEVDARYVPAMFTVNHLRLSEPLGDRQSNVDALRAVADQVPDACLILRSFEGDGKFALGQVDNVGHTSGGGELLWTMWVVARFEHDRIAYQEIFEIEDERLARARFEELAREDPLTL